MLLNLQDDGCANNLDSAASNNISFKLSALLYSKESDIEVSLHRDQNSKGFESKRVLVAEQQRATPCAILCTFQGIFKHA